jgi:hypothetical protein
MKPQQNKSAAAAQGESARRTAHSAQGQSDLK